MTYKEKITVEKEVYEAVLRNSVRVNDLEAENHKLKEINLWHSEKLRDCEKENQQLKKLLLSSRGFVDKERITLETSGFGHNEYCRRTKELLTANDNAIGEKK